MLAPPGFMSCSMHALYRGRAAKALAGLHWLDCIAAAPLPASCSMAALAVSPLCCAVFSHTGLHMLEVVAMEPAVVTASACLLPDSCPSLATCTTQSHLARVGEERCAWVRAMVFANRAMQSRSALQREADNWLAEAGTVPPGAAQRAVVCGRVCVVCGAHFKCSSSKPAGLYLLPLVCFQSFHACGM
jgi:hypothetical protein